MKRYDNIRISAVFAGTGRYICNGTLAILFLLFFGCATVPGPVAVQGNAGAPDQSIAALVDLLKSKNVISDDEADRFTEQSMTRSALNRGAVSASEDVAVLVALLKSKNVISPDEAARLTNQYGVSAVAEKPPAITSETNENEQIEKLNQKVSNVKQKLAELTGSVPEWTKRVRFGGDVRLRYENDRFDENNADEVFQPAKPTEIMNTTVNQDRFRYRVRVGAEVKVNDQMDAVVRLATGNTTNPTSTNTTLGDSMNKDGIVIDQAYLKWKPLEFITVSGGRMPNPWFSTDLVWDNDLNFEGIVLNVKEPLTETLIPFLTAGAFPLQDIDLSSHDKWLFGGQVGLERKEWNGISARIGAAYYYFSNITGKFNDPLKPGETDWTAPQFQQKGNTLFNISADQNEKLAYASGFKEFNLTGTLDIGFWDPVHIVFLGDYVKNFGFHQSRVNDLVGDIVEDDPDDLSTLGFQAPLKETTGYQLGMSVGYPTIREFGQWKAYITYKRLEADAVVDAFTDSDFHLGGTNTRGWILGTEFGLMKNFWLTLKWLTADEISGPPMAIDVLQADVNARF